jgi:acylphosphatase
MNAVGAIVYFKGRVQGVGFRYTCRSISKGYSVTGCVKNLEDGRVELLAEGERSEIEEFLKGIEQSHLKPFIKERAITWTDATGKWRDFHIEH